MPSIEEELSHAKSFAAIENVLVNGKLIQYQAVDVLSMLYRKAAIVSYDTGMGKTFMAAAVIRMLLNRDKNTKILMIIKKKQLLSTPEKIQKNAGVDVIATSADAKGVRENIISERFLNYPVLMITHNCLNNKIVMRKLFEYKHLYSCIIIDEAHNLNNTVNASSASMLKGMCRAFEYRFALTATPITTDVRQSARLASLLDYKTYPDEAKLAQRMLNGSFSIKQDPLFFINRSYADFGIDLVIKGYPLFVQAQPNQLGASGQNLFSICKGVGAYNQANRVVSFIQEHPNERGLIYVNQHSVREWLLPFLERAGIKYGCINGKTSKSSDDEIMMKFNELHQIDVVITSVTEAIDLDCDWVLFYEYTVNVAQMIGRATRGLHSKTLSVYFMITEDTDELAYFYNNIYKVSEVIRRVFDKSYSAVFDVKNKTILKDLA